MQGVVSNSSTYVLASVLGYFALHVPVTDVCSTWKQSVGEATSAADFTIDAILAHHRPDRHHANLPFAVPHLQCACRQGCFLSALLLLAFADIDFACLQVR